MSLFKDKNAQYCLTLTSSLGIVSFLGDMYVESDAGWSSLAARRAHNPKVTGSNPVPATSKIKH